MFRNYRVIQNNQTIALFLYVCVCVCLYVCVFGLASMTVILKLDFSTFRLFLLIGHCNDFYECVCGCVCVCVCVFGLVSMRVILKFDISVIFH